MWLLVLLIGWAVGYLAYRFVRRRDFSMAAGIAIIVVPTILSQVSVLLFLRYFTKALV